MSKLVQGTFKGIKTFTIINPTTYNNDKNWGVTICDEGELGSLGFDENESAEITALNVGDSWENSMYGIRARVVRLA